jgi:hypothetical protein
MPSGFCNRGVYYLGLLRLTHPFTNSTNFQCIAPNPQAEVGSGVGQDAPFEGLLPDDQQGVDDTGQNALDDAVVLLEEKEEGGGGG